MYCMYAEDITSKRPQTRLTVHFPGIGKTDCNPSRRAQILSLEPAYNRG